MLIPRDEHHFDDIDNLSIPCRGRMTGSNWYLLTNKNQYCTTPVLMKQRQDLPDNGTPSDQLLLAAVKAKTDLKPSEVEALAFTRAFGRP